MNKNTISILTRAISAVVDGNNDRAVRLLLLAVRDLSGTASAPSSGNQRGAKPLLNVTQATALVQRVKDGESVVNVAKAFGISYQTAHRYVSKARKASATA
jgi:hypothetical protein